MHNGSEPHLQTVRLDERPQAASLPARVEDRLAKLPLVEIKHYLAQGALLSSLQNDTQKCSEEDPLTGIRISEERYEEGSAFLILNLEFKKPGTRLGYGKDLILQYLTDEGSSDEGPIRFWYYPDDPELPNLSRLASSSTFLQTVSWDRPARSGVEFGEEILIQRLLYNPGRRAAFLLSSEQGGKKRVLEIIRPKEFQGCLDKYTAIESSGLHDRINFPRRIAASGRESLFLYDYIPGLRIDKLEPGGMRNIRAALFEEVARILSEIHQIAIPGLSQWIPQQEIGMMSCFSECLEGAGHSTVLAVIRPVFEKLSECFIQKSGAYTHLIHNSFSAKQLLYDPGASGF